MNAPRTIGILGGMGPLATVDLYRKIIEATPANSDQEHLPVLIDADPRVPDRTAALLEDGEDPTPWLIRGAQRLEAAGASFIIIPCNTAHAFLEPVRSACSIPIVDMIDEAARVTSQLIASGGTAGILATRGTIAACLYQAALERHGLRWVVPDEDDQNQVMETIYHVKSGKTDPTAAAPALSTARVLAEGGANALLAACTELPVVLRQDDLNVPLIDPTDVLARAAVNAATEDRTFQRLQRGVEKARSNVS